MEGFTRLLQNMGILQKRRAASDSPPYYFSVVSASIAADSLIVSRS